MTRYFVKYFSNVGFSCLVFSHAEIWAVGFGKEDRGGEVPPLLLKTCIGSVSLKINFNSLKLIEKVPRARIEPTLQLHICLCFPSPFPPLTPSSSLLPEQGHFISPGLCRDDFFSSFIWERLINICVLYQVQSLLSLQDFLTHSPSPRLVILSSTGPNSIDA